MGSGFTDLLGFTNIWFGLPPTLSVLLVASRIILGSVVRKEITIDSEISRTITFDSVIGNN
jgi:hypothetical protein